MKRNLSGSGRIEDMNEIREDSGWMVRIVKMEVGAELVKEMFDLGDVRCIVGAKYSPESNIVTFYVADSAAPDGAVQIHPTYMEGERGRVRMNDCKYSDSSRKVL